MRRSHVYIVGAGFSHYAGLPLQAGFTEALLEPRNDNNYPLRPLLDRLGEFVHDAFDHNTSAKASFWPDLEDVFTNIDLAANSGHHLGETFPPSKLRTVRLILLARTISMLHERFCAAEIRKDYERKKSRASGNWETSGSDHGTPWAGVGLVPSLREGIPEGPGTVGLHEWSLPVRV